ncbi:MAG TPA: NAD(P)-dependent alcohol dehydrogenase [Bacteroidales bacterium]|nr:NAD(P)-dependent alcohol dehydrogenase [Bacteroidales bacterium]
MKAFLCTKYGPPEVLKPAEVEKPIPKDDEVLIRIYSAAVTASDIYIRSGKVAWNLMVPFRIMMGITRPRKQVIGEVLSGEIEATGKSIKRFRPGDRIYGLTGFSLGAYAEYKCMKENDSTNGCIAMKPGNISFDEATMAAYGGLLAFQFMEKANIQRGQEVLIYGASSTTGTIGIQLAKSLGARVTAICSTSNIDYVKSFGADHAIDYTKQKALYPGMRYDFIFDAVGRNKTSALKKSLVRNLSSEGIMTSIDDESLKLDSKRLDLLTGLIEAGYIKPYIDKSYSFEELVEAHRFVETGHKRGGVAVRLTVI